MTKHTGTQGAFETMTGLDNGRTEIERALYGHRHRVESYTLQAGSGRAWRHVLSMPVRCARVSNACLAEQVIALVAGVGPLVCPPAEKVRVLFTLAGDRRQYVMVGRFVEAANA